MKIFLFPRSTFLSDISLFLPLKFSSLLLLLLSPLSFFLSLPFSFFCVLPPLLSRNGKILDREKIFPLSFFKSSLSLSLSPFHSLPLSLSSTPLLSSLYFLLSVSPFHYLPLSLSRATPLFIAQEGEIASPSPLFVSFSLSLSLIFFSPFSLSSHDRNCFCCEKSFSPYSSLFVVVSSSSLSLSFSLSSLSFRLFRCSFSLSGNYSSLSPIFPLSPKLPSLATENFRSREESLSFLASTFSLSLSLLCALPFSPSLSQLKFSRHEERHEEKNPSVSLSTLSFSVFFLLLCFSPSLSSRLLATEVTFVVRELQGELLFLSPASLFP